MYGFSGKSARCRSGTRYCGARSAVSLYLPPPREPRDDVERKSREEKIFLGLRARRWNSEVGVSQQLSALLWVAGVGWVMYAQ
jgi:hypothetical protein